MVATEIQKLNQLRFKEITYEEFEENLKLYVDEITKTLKDGNKFTNDRKMEMYTFIFEAGKSTGFYNHGDCKLKFIEILKNYEHSKTKDKFFNIICFIFRPLNYTFIHHGFLELKKIAKYVKQCPESTMSETVKDVGGYKHY